MAGFLFNRYTEAYVIAAGTIKLGKLIKTGSLWTSAALFLLVLATTKGVPFFIFGGILFVSIIGFIGFIGGTIVVSQGQMMLAILDTAVNTSPLAPSEEKAYVMNLTVTTPDRKAA